MLLECFVQSLESSLKSTDNITYYVSTAKGIVTVIGSYDFPKLVTYEDAFKKTESNFAEVESLFNFLRNKYKNLYLKNNLITKTTAINYDLTYNERLERKIKSELRAENNTICSSISFRYPNKE